MNQQVRLTLTFVLGGLATLYFLDFMEVLTPGTAMRDYYYLKVFGSFGLIELLSFSIEQLIVYLMRSEKEKEQVQLVKWRVAVDKLLFSGSGHLGSSRYKECCKLLDKIFKDKYLTIEEKKELYDRVSFMWSYIDEDKRCVVYLPAPPEIQKKWKKAQADDKLRQLKKDF